MVRNESVLGTAENHSQTPQVNKPFGTQIVSAKRHRLSPDCCLPEDAKRLTKESEYCGKPHEL